MSGRKRVGLVGMGCLLIGGYVLGIDEGEQPGSTDAKLLHVRDLGATAAVHSVGAVQDMRAIAGPALGDLGSAVGGAVTPTGTTDGGQLESLVTPPPGG